MANVQAISIHRKPGVPEVPSPFFANGRPTWSAVLAPETIEELSDVWKNPKSRFKNTIESVYVDGKCVYKAEK